MHEMRDYRVRMYDDHYLVTDATVGVGTFVVDVGELEAALAEKGPGKEAAVPKMRNRKPRARRTKEQIARDKIAAEEGTQDSAAG